MIEKFFEWAMKVKGLNMTEIAAVMGYNLRHLYRIRNGEVANL
jgi:hypothetical protein